MVVEDLGLVPMPMPAAAIKPTHKAIQVYYDTLQGLAALDARHEGAVRTAFQRLLEDTGKARGWTLVAEKTIPVKGKNIRPDGILYDDMLRIGFWEAKDKADRLDDEIRKKIATGYPLNNTIFENTVTAVLFQNGQEALRVGLDQRQNLADLLNQFYAHTEPNIEGFHQAVTEFKDQIPELARAARPDHRGARGEPEISEGV